jgi:hypothetical protein
MTIPSAAWQIVVAMFEQKRMDYPATEDGARAWTRATCEQLLFAEPTGGWCAKSAGAGRPQSKDVVARRLGGRFEGWGVLTAAGAQGPRQLTDPPEYFDLTGQVPIDVEPVNHLDASGDGSGKGDGGGTSGGVDVTQLMAALERVVTALEDLTAATEVLTDSVNVIARDGVRVRVV